MAEEAVVEIAGEGLELAKKLLAMTSSSSTNTCSLGI
jgi:hypothetical protein